MGSIGDCYHNGLMESFWARMQVELLNRKRWNTRLELANAIFEYLEIFHNRQRRHSSLGMLSPIEYEVRHADNIAAIKQADRAKPGAHESLHQTRGGSVRTRRNPDERTRTRVVLRLMAVSEKSPVIRQRSATWTRAPAV